MWPIQFYQTALKRQQCAERLRQNTAKSFNGIVQYSNKAGGLTIQASSEPSEVLIKVFSF